MRFDRIAILDWSAARGAKRGKDSIWIGVADASGTRCENIATRPQAAARLTDLTQEAIAQGTRLLIGADFAFGFPQGFAPALTGVASALSVWDWLSVHVTDTAGNVSNYREVAARINARFSGGGPFWGNGMATDMPGLPRLKPPLPPGFGANRRCDLVAREGGVVPKTVWQLAGAGAVGAQVLTGLPVLNTLRRSFGKALCVWPFHPPETPVVLAEVYPSLLHARVRAQVAKGVIADKAQVDLLATALFRHGVQGTLGRLMRPDDPAALAEEGWILGAGQSALLNAGLPP